jgi:8-oxo-dGTP diphosphatase
MTEQRPGGRSDEATPRREADAPSADVPSADAASADPPAPERVWRDRATAGIVLVDDRGRILMQLRDDIPTIADPGAWVVPGGEIDPHETPEEGARREFLEETGYRAPPGGLRLVLTRDLPRPQGTIERQYYFLGRYDGVQPIACYEGQELRFLDPGELAGLKTSPGLSEVVTRVVAPRNAGSSDS